MADAPKPNDDDPLILVRRQWNDWRDAAYRLSKIGRLHWDCISGGIGQMAPRSFVHGYVMCNEMESGEIAHSCRHGPPPHLIKVCVIKKTNKDVFKRVLERMEQDSKTTR